MLRLYVNYIQFCIRYHLGHQVDKPPYPYAQFRNASLALTQVCLFLV
ncbi:Protein of unknown function [Pyronema omphalodes CBS 100304]|uniref:Uncharacterized protein n=1 Tax=Pyronema omphalodes (strain CBS 100304) TaxID=1076935 RepID=U4LJ03_PYROM|nr:Protein of unknown function [Pyronema omphalodes CBS 100304]